MHRSVVIVAAIAALAGCSAGEETLRQAGDSAESIADNLSARELCDTVRDELSTIGSAAQRLVDDPSLRVQLAPEITRAAEQLGNELGEQIPTPWQEVADATTDLGASLRDANEATVRLTASEAVLAVRVAQTGCGHT